MNDPNLKTFGAGQVLFKEGEKGGNLFFIKSGQVELSVQDKATGETVVVSVVGDQSVLGTVTFLESEPRSATAKCLSEVKCVVVTEVQRQKLLDSIPKWFRILVKDLAKNLRRANEKYSEIQKKHELLEKRYQVLKRKLEAAEAEAEAEEEAKSSDSQNDKMDETG